LVLALAQGILFSRRLTRPIEEVTALAGAIARAPGGPWETVAVRTNDEVGELATAFNQMIVRLEEARTELERRIAAATRNIGTLYEVARTTTSTLEVAAVLELVAEKTLGALGLGRLLVLWHPPELGDAVDVYAAAAGHPGERLEIAAPLDLAGLCPGARSTLIAPARLPAALADRLPAPRLLCLPLVFKGDPLGVSMDLGMLERARDLGAPALRARLREVRDQISRLMQDVRTMSQVLRPPMLDFGLVPTLHWFVEKFTESSEIEVRLQTPPEETRL